MPEPEGDQGSRFRMDWVLVQELAVGPAPRADRHLDRLSAEGIAAILSLCSEQEAPPPSGLATRFAAKRLVLPDHRCGRLPELGELEEALAALVELRRHGPVYVHCVAGMERSPLVCLGWLMRQHRLTPQRALDYLMQAHPGTNPLPGQLALLSQLA
jgi:hypothetical protein